MMMMMMMIRPRVVVICDLIHSFVVYYFVEMLFFRDSFVHLYMNMRH